MPSPAKLTNREIQKLHEGLVALDGVPASGGGLLRFDLDDATVWSVAKNRAVIERAADVANKALKTLGAKYGVVEGVKIVPENAAQIAAYMDAREKLWDQEQELTGLTNLRQADLKRAKVTVPGIITNLLPLIEA